MPTLEEFIESLGDDGSEDAREKIKRWVLSEVFGSESFKPVGIATYGHEGIRVHVRHTWATVRCRFWFDVNPNTVKADYELWICGMPSLWYLVPVSALVFMQGSPTAYRNTAREATTEVTVNEIEDTCRFARNEKPLDVSAFRHGTLKKKSVAGQAHGAS